MEKAQHQQPAPYPIGSTEENSYNHSEQLNSTYQQAGYEQGDQQNLFGSHYQMLQDRDLLDEFSDKEFNENITNMVHRLNRNLKDFDMSGQQVTMIDEDINSINEFKKQTYYARPSFKDSQKPFKTSHISHIQSLYTHRDVFANRLKEYDQFKSIQNHSFIKNKIIERQQSVNEMSNMFGPIKSTAMNFSKPPLLDSNSTVQNIN